uniref:Signal recognition particle protein n=1 Tax=Taenia asiatica TaxID=60517 RepID=A0A0R3VXX0_TAEAS
LLRQTGSIMPEIRTMDRMCGQQRLICQRPAAAPQQKAYTSDMLPSSPEPKRRHGFRRLFKKKSKKSGAVAT